VTLRIPTHLAAPSHALVLREGPKPTRPRGRIPRVARLLALAHHFQELLDTCVVETQAELAKLTPARVTQIMNLLALAPDIQEEIFFLPLVTEGRPAGVCTHFGHGVLDMPASTAGIPLQQLPLPLVEQARLQLILVTQRRHRHLVTKCRFRMAAFCSDVNCLLVRCWRITCSFWRP
jgi:hypothetical protein